MKENYKDIKAAGLSLLSEAVSILIKNMKYILVLFLGVIIGIIISNNMNSVNNSNIGCIFLCTFAPIYNQNQSFKEPINAPKKLNYNLEIRREDMI